MEAAEVHPDRIAFEQESFGRAGVNRSEDQIK